jgi:3-oxoacyl-[acyl-carrier protein] reductase
MTAPDSNSLVILITGTSRGIGRYLAEYYCGKGHTVFGCARSEATLTHERYHHVKADVSSESDIKHIISQIRKTAFRLDVVINNAAVNPRITPVMLTPASSFEKAFSINLLGTFLVSREAAKLMLLKKFGRIINFSSMAAHHRVAGEAVYTATKAGIEAFTSVMAKEVYGHGITCNAVAPAAVDSDLSRAVNADALQEILARNAVPKLGRMEDISNAVDWLIRPESQAITGQVIYLGGV